MSQVPQQPPSLVDTVQICLFAVPVPPTALLALLGHSYAASVLSRLCILTGQGTYLTHLLRKKDCFRRLLDVFILMRFVPKSSKLIVVCFKKYVFLLFVKLDSIVMKFRTL